MKVSLNVCWELNHARSKQLKGFVGILAPNNITEADLQIKEIGIVRYIAVFPFVSLPQWMKLSLKRPVICVGSNTLVSKFPTSLPLTYLNSYQY